MSYLSFGWAGEDREIKVVLKDGVWMTEHFIEGEPDPLVTKMFGSHQLPTPWTEETDRDTVVQELTARNAHAKIS